MVYQQSVYISNKGNKQNADLMMQTNDIECEQLKYLRIIKGTEPTKGELIRY